VLARAGEGVRKIIGAHHFIADLTLPYGRVIHDYLATVIPAKVTDNPSPRRKPGPIE